ncbi:hypothetical protein ACK9YZ_24910 [Rhizobium sp. ZK1]|uniref:hypothetical protein n=1 Tax=Rhizobium sp. ZK1 TaxID=3389872 RepID=UPI0039F6D451
MEKYLLKADAQGKIDVNGQLSPVGYSLSVKEGMGHSFEISIRLLAPRDWLLRRGFEKDAVLISQSGTRIPIYHDGERLHVGDNLSVELSARDDSCLSREDLFRKYPELDGSQVARV